MLVHVRESEMPNDLVYIAIDIPASVRIARVRIAQLPRNWRQYPAPQQLADIGSRWAERGRTAVLAVPSVVTRLEWNYLVKPLYPAFRRLRIGRPESFKLDPRFLE
jgi:RES domain-containing protein